MLKGSDVSIPQVGSSGCDIRSSGRINFGSGIAFKTHTKGRQLSSKSPSHESCQKIVFVGF